MPETVPAPLRTDEPPDSPAPAPPRAAGTYCVCEFCECKVTRSGEVFQMSEKARTYRDNVETHRKAIAKLDEQITELRASISAKEAEIATLKGASKKRSSLSDALL